MDTLEFFRRVLPEQGYKVIGVALPKPYKGFKHHVEESIEAAAATASRLDGQEEAVYHACAGFLKPQVTVTRPDHKTGEMVEKAAIRIADNAGWARSFWVDLDVGTSTETLRKYATQREAAADILRVCKEQGIPSPMLVSSGYGVHAYWPLDADLPIHYWFKVACRFKALLAHLNVRQDPSRTADAASVLRPVGSHNRKNGGEKAVKLILDAQPMSLSDFAKPVLEAAKRLGVQDTIGKKKQALNSDLFGGHDYPPSSAAQAASKCQALAEVRDSGGNVPEPVWRAALGLIKFCTEGEELAHEWSRGHAGYDPYETQEKFERWAGGPATCSLFASHGMCNGCQYAGKITSPIRLGIELPEQPPTQAPVQRELVAEAAPVQPEPERTGDGLLVLPPLPESMRQSFAYRNGTLFFKYEDDEGVPQLLAVCQEYIVPYAVVRPLGDAKQGNKAMLKCWRYTLANTREEITLPFAAMATGGKDLVVAFGEMGIAVEGGPMTKYMKNWIAELKLQSEDSLSVERMGWQGNDFIVGATRYTAEGRAPASLSGQLKSYATAFAPTGTLEDWVRLIDEAYNRPGQEQFQFIMACGFGAALLPFVGDYRGIIVSAVSYKSGQGKTTAQRAAMSIYGDASRLETAFGRQTQNALYEKLGAMGNLPFMIDEVSNIDSATLADMAYAISQGIQKDRLQKDGAMRAQREPWQTLVLTSGNRSLIQALAADGSAREPEMRRIFEFPFQVVSDLPKSKADRIFRELSRHSGVAGPVFVDYIVRNRSTVQALVEAVSDKVNELFALKREERFWGAAITAALAGLQIANKLGLVGFTVKAVTPWVRAQLEDLRGAVLSGSGDEYDLLNRLMVDLNFDLWVTSDHGTRNGRPAHVLREPRRGAVAGRYIVSDDLLLIRPEYVRDWCESKRADHRGLRNFLVEKHCMAPGTQMPNRDVLAGIANVSPLKGRVWEIKASKLRDLSPEMDLAATEATSAKVVPLRPQEVS